MARDATIGDIRRLLREHSADFAAHLDAPEVQLSVPVDGKGARVRVSVRDMEGRTFGKAVVYRLDGEEVKIPIEVAADYQEYQPAHRP